MVSASPTSRGPLTAAVLAATLMPGLTRPSMPIRPDALGRMVLFDLIKRLLVVNDSFEPILSHSALRRSFRIDAHDRLSVETLARDRPNFRELSCLVASLATAA